MRDSHQQINMAAIRANLGKWQGFQAKPILETIRAPNPANDDTFPTKTIILT